MKQRHSKPVETSTDTESVVLKLLFTDSSINLDYVCMYGHTYSKSVDNPGKVANPARGQLNRKKWSSETGWQSYLRL